MLTVFIRTVIIYIVLIIILRIMGKRQLGELDMGEFVITILLSELATIPIADTSAPMSHALISIFTLAILEILTSGAIMYFPWIKKLMSSRPAVIISRGRLDVKTMRKVRISVEELVTQIRQNGIFDIQEVDYAILEENGKMSIIPKSRYRQPDIDSLSLPDDDSGVMHILVSDGVINTHNMELLNKSRSWLEKLLVKQRLTLSDILCMTVNDAGSVYIIKEDGSTLSP